VIPAAAVHSRGPLPRNHWPDVQRP
jgi:hypothetical protein